MIKRFIIAFVLLAVVIGGIVGFNLFRDRAIQDFFANMPLPTVTVATVTAEPKSWTPTIEAIGTVNASRGVDLTVETSGIITAVNFGANQEVKAGDVLVQLDDAIQQADLDAGRTQARLDQQSLQRARELSQRGVSSNVTLESAQAAAQASEAQVQRAEALLAQRQLRAPFDGVVGIPRVDVGQYLTPGTVVVTLQDRETMHADFTVPEQQLSRLRMGQPLVVTLDGQEGVFNGKIIGIDPKIDSGSRLVFVRAEIENPDNVLTSGQFARIAVQLPSEDDIIVLPQTTVVTSLYGDYVYVVRPMEQEEKAEQQEAAEQSAEAAEAAGQPQTPPATQQVAQVFVEVGRRNGGEVEIRSGVKPGDVVVSAGQNRLNNGSPVTIDNTVNPAGTAAAAEAPEQVTQQ